MPDLVLTGLPAGELVSVIDRLTQVERGGTTRSSIVAVRRVDAAGGLTVTGLRDSIYSVLFHRVGMMRHSRRGLQVGDRANFRKRIVHQTPPPVILKTATPVEDRVELAWIFPPDGYGAKRTSAWVLEDGASAWQEAAFTTNEGASGLSIQGLAPDTVYQVRVRGESAAGGWIGYSNVLSFTTNSSNNQNVNLLADGSFEAGVWD